MRQLRDWKGSATVEAMNPQLMTDYGRSCGEVLARAHARTGDRIASATTRRCVRPPLIIGCRLSRNCDAHQRRNIRVCRARMDHCYGSPCAATTVEIHCQFL